MDIFSKNTLSNLIYYTFEKIKTVTSFCFHLSKPALFAFFLVFVLFPIIENSINIKGFLETRDVMLLSGYTSIIIFFAFVTWAKLNIWLWKYKNTLQLIKKFKFAYTDYLFCAIHFFVIFTVEFLFTKYNNSEISQEVIYFFLFNTTILLEYFILAYWYPQKIPVEIDHSFISKDNLSDEPIESSNNDILNRQKFVKGLYAEINNLRITDSFVFGLYGKWGEGKSSVLNLLRSIFKKNNDFIVMSFEPWNYKNEEAILKAFFNTLEKTLSNKYLLPEFKKIIYRYRNIITYGMSAMGIKANLNFEEETISEIKEKIENFIKSTNKKLLIIIDEIDRLNKKEMLLIFKLVRANSNFRNSIFLLSMDEKKVIERLKYGEGFLEKVVQKPIKLPKIEYTFINKYLFISEHKIPKYTTASVKTISNGKVVSVYGFITKNSNGIVQITDNLETKENTINVFLKAEQVPEFNKGEKIFIEGIKIDSGISLEYPLSILTRYRLSKLDLFLKKMLYKKKIQYEEIEYFDKEFGFLWQTYISKIIHNLRDAKRFMNSLYSSYPPIAKEVNLFDFVCLEILKVFVKPVYDDIFENWWFYIDNRSENDAIFSNPYTIKKSEDRKKETSEHVQEILQDYVNEPNKRDIIHEILKTLFPKLKDHQISMDTNRQIKSISTGSFLKYFTLSVPSNEIPTSFISNIISKWQKSKCTSLHIKEDFLKFQKDGKLSEFLKRLNNTFLQNFDEILTQKVVDSITISIKEFSKKDGLHERNSEYTNAVSLISKIFKSKYEPKEIQEKIDNITNKTSDYLYATHLIMICQSEFANILDLTKAKKTLINRLNAQYINNNEDITVDFPDDWKNILLQWSSNWLELNTLGKDRITKYISKILSNNVEKFIDLVKSFNENYSPFNNKWIMNYDKYSKIYNLKILQALAKKMLADNIKLDPADKDMLEEFNDVVTQKN